MPFTTSSYRKFDDGYLQAFFNKIHQAWQVWGAYTAILNVGANPDVKLVSYESLYESLNETIVQDLVSLQNLLRNHPFPKDLVDDAMALTAVHAEENIAGSTTFQIIPFALDTMYSDQHANLAGRTKLSNSPLRSAINDLKLTPALELDQLQNILWKWMPLYRGDGQVYGNHDKVVYNPQVNMIYANLHRQVSYYDKGSQKTVTVQSIKYNTIYDPLHFPIQKDNLDGEVIAYSGKLSSRSACSMWNPIDIRAMGTDVASLGPGIDLPLTNSCFWWNNTSDHDPYLEGRIAPILLNDKANMRGAYCDTYGPDPTKLTSITPRGWKPLVNATLDNVADKIQKYLDLYMLSQVDLITFKDNKLSGSKSNSSSGKGKGKPRRKNKKEMAIETEAEEE
jgi:hypothetical protein